jgi:hypothetical protein
MREMDDALTRSADLVLVTSRALYQQKKPLSTHVHYLPSGVDFELFNLATRVDFSNPAELVGIPGPLIGYVGGVTNYRIEWTWIEALARRMPEAAIVFIGPLVETPPRSVTSLANMIFVGQKRPDELPQYLRPLDVGIIPYKGHAFLQSCQPTKTFEYLAAGLGVVSAPIPELEPYSEVVRFAAGETEFVDRVREMLGLSHQQDFQARCVEIARGKTWDARLEAASRLVGDALERKSKAQADGSPRA